jgi:hypothetical protein
MRSSVPTVLIAAALGRTDSVGAAAAPLDAAQQSGARRSLLTLQAGGAAGLKLLVGIHREHHAPPQVVSSSMVMLRFSAIRPHRQRYLFLTSPVI